MKILYLIMISGFLIIVGISASLIAYSYLNYAQMMIVRLDRTLSHQPVNFVDISDNVLIIPKLQESINEVGRKYDAMLAECNNNNETKGYCNGLPISTMSTATITGDEFQIINKTLQLKLNGINGANIWDSHLKWYHEGCFPPARSFQLESSRSDNYCYYDIIVVRK